MQSPRSPLHLQITSDPTLGSIEFNYYLPKFDTWHPNSSSRRERKLRPISSGGDVQINWWSLWIIPGFTNSSAHNQQRSWSHAHRLPPIWIELMRGKWKRSGTDFRLLLLNLRILSLGNLDRPLMVVNWLLSIANSPNETRVGGASNDDNEQPSKRIQVSLVRPAILSIRKSPISGLPAKLIHSILGVYREKSGISLRSDLYKNILCKTAGRKLAEKFIGFVPSISKSVSFGNPRK